MITVDDGDRDRIDRFLLGTAGEEEREQVEQRLFADDAFFADLEGREDDLIDDYAHGRLGEGERVAFERRFLASAEGRQRVAFARAASRLTRTAGRPAWAPPWLAVAAAIAFAASTAVLGVRTLQVARQRQDEHARSAAREQALQGQLETERTLRSAPQVPVPPAIVLGAQGSRDGGVTPELARPADAGPIVIAVPLPDGPAFASYQAVLRTVEGALAWEDAGLQPDKGRIVVTIPAPALPPGDYILTVGGRRRTGPPAELLDRYFRVTR